MQKTTHFTVLLLTLTLVTLACSLGGGGQAATPDQAAELATVVAATLEAADTPANAPAEEPVNAPADDDANAILPHTLYYLSDVGSGGFQVWRMERDSITQTQLTHEAVPVDEFAVAATDGRVAYIANNQLFLIGADGSGRTLLVDGGPIDIDSESYHYGQKISGLAWSPDGSVLAYGQGGINLYNFNSHDIRRVVENELEQVDDNFILPRALYFPHSWSPDNRYLLTEIGFYEGGSLGIFDPASGSLIQLGNGIVCCLPNWTSDSQAVLVGSPYVGMIISGLWHFNAVNGMMTELIASQNPDETFNLVGWPWQLPNGDLLYFYTNTIDFPEGDQPLTLVRSGADGNSGRAAVRPESWEIYEVLWAPDGSLAITIQPAPGENDWPRHGPVVLIDTAGGPPRPLVTNAYFLLWGP